MTSYAGQPQQEDCSWAGASGGRVSRFDGGRALYKQPGRLRMPSMKNSMRGLLVAAVILVAGVIPFAAPSTSHAGTCKLRYTYEEDGITYALYDCGPGTTAFYRCRFTESGRVCGFVQ